jgi:hypothetical protein
MPERPDIVRHIAEHGGISRIHVTPFTNAAHEVIGWQNVLICMDGVRVGLSPGQEREITGYDEYLLGVKREWAATHGE